MENVRQIDPGIILVVITGFATVETAVDAMKHGAYDYIPKPFNPDQLMASSTGARQEAAHHREGKAPRREGPAAPRVASAKSKLHAIVNSMVTHPLSSQGAQLVLWNPAVLKMLNVRGRVDDCGVVWISRRRVKQQDLIDAINKAFSPDSSQYTIISEEVVLAGETPKTLMVNVAGVRDERGENLGVVCTFRDISRLKEVEEIKSQFVRMVAHEIRRLGRSKAISTPILREWRARTPNSTGRCWSGQN
jgi:CheY-like chemotaxis protein